MKLSIRRLDNKTSNRILAYIIGFSLAIYPINNDKQPLLHYFFLPTVGLGLIAIAVLLYCVESDWHLNLGPKWVWIPMFIIAASMTARIAITPNMDAVASALYGWVLVCLYFVARDLGKDIVKVLIPFIIVEALSVIIFGVWLYPGQIAGGIITSPPNALHEANYVIAAGYMVFGVVLLRGRWQWLLAGLVLVALFFTGAAETLFIVSVLGAVVIIRRDWGKRLWIPLGCLTIVVLAWTAAGHTGQLYQYAEDRINSVKAIVTGQQSIVVEGNTYDSSQFGELALHGRLSVDLAAIKNISILGHGVVLDNNEPNTVHNVPLIIMDQIGPVAALAWLFMVIMLTVKTKWKYAWIAVLTMSVFDHYIWDQLGGWVYLLAGLSTVELGKQQVDLIFRRPKVDKQEIDIVK
jgi:hypothetical protein